MPTEAEHRMFSAHKAETAELQRLLAQSRASVKMLQDVVRDEQAKRGRLREPCLSILTTVDYTHARGSVCVVTRASLDRIKAALEPTP